MSEPTTQAGKRLLADVIREDDFGGIPQSTETTLAAILAIEAEAREQERERIAAAVRALEPVEVASSGWGRDGVLHIDLIEPTPMLTLAAVLVAIREEAEPS